LVPFYTAPRRSVRKRRSGDPSVAEGTWEGVNRNHLKAWACKTGELAGQRIPLDGSAKEVDWRDFPGKGKKTETGGISAWDEKLFLVLAPWLCKR